jgi:DNA-binding Xre family transcriptional regulator
MRTLTAVPTRFRLQEALDEHDPPVSQRELADRTGLSPTTVNRMCKNLTAQVSLATLDAIARVLGIHPGDVIDYEVKRTKK